MKRCVIVVVLLFLAGSAPAQRAVPTKATFVVKDDSGQSVANAQLSGGFRDVSNAGSRDRFEGVTDTNGLFIAKGNAVIGVGAWIRCEGCYDTKVSRPLDHKNRQKLEHWDVEVPVLLKRIRNPISMYAKQIENPYVSAFESVGKYCLGRTSSYDILKGSFLPPYGSGDVADLGFKWKMTIYETNKVGRALEFDSLCEILTTNILDGICKGKPDGVRGGDGCYFLSNYEAPIDGYTNVISFYRNVRGSKAESNDDQHYLYYFRIRTQTNEFGQVTNASYGKIYGQLNGNFTYYLNPTPNDRNVEFAPNNNLYKNLGQFEKVNVP